MRLNYSYLGALKRVCFAFILRTIMCTFLPQKLKKIPSYNLKFSRQIFEMVTLIRKNSAELSWAPFLEKFRFFEKFTLFFHGVHRRELKGGDRECKIFETNEGERKCNLGKFTGTQRV